VHEPGQPPRAAALRRCEAERQRLRADSAFGNAHIAVLPGASTAHAAFAL